MILGKKVKIDDCGYAIPVLINYLEGAIADFEENMLETDCCIWGSINTLYLLGDVGDAIEFEKQMNEIINKRKER